MSTVIEGTGKCEVYVVSIVDRLTFSSSGTYNNDFDSFNLKGNVSLTVPVNSHSQSTTLKQPLQRKDAHEVRAQNGNLSIKLDDAVLSYDVNPLNEYFF